MLQCGLIISPTQDQQQEELFVSLFGTFRRTQTILPRNVTPYVNLYVNTVLHSLTKIHTQTHSGSLSCFLFFNMKDAKHTNMHMREHT